MTTTTKTADFVGRALITPDSDARDYLLRATGAGDRDFMGRLLTGGSEDPVQALLDEAAVRFDFSEYDDIADMVDVNGGWGPIGDSAGTLVNVSSEFTEEGLHLAIIDPGFFSMFLRIEGDAGPLMFGPDGLTIVDVRRVHTGWPAGQSAGLVDLLADGTNDAAPQMTFRPARGDPSLEYPPVATDYTPVVVTDTPDTYDTVFDQTMSCSLQSTTESGIFVTIVVLDLVAQEVRATRSSPDFAAETVTLSLEKPVPDFMADPKVIDVLYYNQNVAPEDQTMIELLGWNRALTAGEVDDLVAHFTG